MLLAALLLMQGAATAPQAPPRRCADVRNGLPER